VRRPIRAPRQWGWLGKFGGGGRLSENFITLQCRNCNGKLDVYEDKERFACGYCGTEVVVQSKGGTIILRAVTEAIKRVEIGTEKTAAELVITRYETDLKRIREKEKRMEEGARSGLGFGGLVTVFGAFLIGTGTVSVGQS
jgi:ribosomal protein S27E